MANIRKHSLPSGLIRWEVAYIDGGGERRAKLFATKTAAASWLIEVQHDLKRGLHTASSVSPTVKEAAALWIERCKAKQLEATTVKGYEEHIDLHIVPFIGAKKLADLTVPAVNAFADELGKAGRSGAMIKKIVRSLGSVFKEARRRGLSNVAPTIGLDLDLPERADPRPVIPTKPELQAIIAKATERASRLWRAPVRLLGLETDNQALDLLRQLVGIAHRPPRAIAQGLKPVLLVAIENLVAGLVAPIICVQGLRWAAPTIDASKWPDDVRCNAARAAAGCVRRHSDKQPERHRYDPNIQRIVRICDAPIGSRRGEPAGCSIDGPTPGPPQFRRVTWMSRFASQQSWMQQSDRRLSSRRKYEKSTTALACRL